LKRAVDQLIEALDAVPDSNQFSDLLQDALDRAAVRQKLRSPWTPKASDPRLQGRLGACAAELTLVPGESKRDELRAFLVEECERCTLDLVRRIQLSPTDQGAVSAWVGVVTPRLLGICRLWLSRNRWLLGGGLTPDEVVRDLMGDLWLHLLERDARVIRQFHGHSPGQWQAFLRTTAIRHLRGGRRAIRAGNRMPDGGLVRLSDLDGQDRANSSPAAAEFQVELTELKRALDQYEKTSPNGPRNRGWLERQSAGETVSEIARSEPNVPRATIGAAISNLRRLLSRQTGRDKGDSE
jgi:hypothetical protein